MFYFGLSNICNVIEFYGSYICYLITLVVDKRGRESNLKNKSRKIEKSKAFAKY